MIRPFDSASPISAENNPSFMVAEMEKKFCSLLNILALETISDTSHLYDSDFWAQISNCCDLLLDLAARLEDEGREPLFASFTNKLEAWLVALYPNSDSSDDSSSATTNSSGGSSSSRLSDEDKPPTLADVIQRLQVVESMLKEVEKLEAVENAKLREDFKSETEKADVAVPDSPPGNGSPGSSSTGSPWKGRRIVFADEIPTPPASECESVTLNIYSCVPKAVRILLNQARDSLVLRIPLSPRPSAPRPAISHKRSGSDSLPPKRLTSHKRTDSNRISQVLKPKFVRRKVKVMQPVENELPLQEVRPFGSFGTITEENLAIAEKKCAIAIRDLVEAHAQPLAVHFQLMVDLHTCQSLYYALVTLGDLRGCPVRAEDVRPKLIPELHKFIDE